MNYNLLWAHSYVSVEFQLIATLPESNGLYEPKKLELRLLVGLMPDG